MSDLSIPGVTNKYNTQKIIDALMEVERVPLTRMEKEVALKQRQKTAWMDMTRELAGLRDSARALFGFQNPFNEKIGSSSDEKVLTATVTREALEETKRIEVKRIATPDRFLSRSLPNTFTVEAGDYSFKVGDGEVRFSFKGGSLRDFVDALNARGGTLLRASLVADTKDTQVLLIEGKASGSKNRLTFADKSAELAVAAGMLERTITAARVLPLDRDTIREWTKPLTPDGYSLRDGALTVNPGTELKISVTPSMSLNKNMVLEMSVKTEIIPEKPVEVKPPPGPTVPPTGGIEFGGIRIESEASQTPLPPWQPPKQPEKVNDMKMLFIEGNGALVELPETADSTDFRKIQVPVGELAAAIDSLDVRNRNTHRRIVLSEIRLFDKTQRGDFTPTRALSEAGDAVLSMDGIEASRATNAIDDLIPGVTLSLKAPSPVPVELVVKRDVEGITKQIVGMVGAYNRVITDVDILTRTDERIIEEAGYLSEEEKKKAKENLGLLVGDLTLQQLKSKMQTTMMNPYPTSLGRDLALMAQIGISTDTRAPGSTAIDKTKLRGYLEIDEQKLTGAVEARADAVKELFGADTDGDLVVNAGVGYSLDALLRPYVMTAGILLQKSSNIDSEITREKGKIADYNKHLDDYQATLKKKYGQMESALDLLEKSSQTIENFNKQTNQ